MVWQLLVFSLCLVSFQSFSFYDNQMKKLPIKCPRCGAVAAWEDNPSRPFCSEKCRLVDLGNWANEDYTIAGGKAPQHDRDIDLDF